MFVWSCEESMFLCSSTCVSDPLHHTQNTRPHHILSMWVTRWEIRPNLVCRMFSALDEFCLTDFNIWANELTTNPLQARFWSPECRFNVCAPPVLFWIAHLFKAQTDRPCLRNRLDITVVLMWVHSAKLSCLREQWTAERKHSKG